MKQMLQSLEKEIATRNISTQDVSKYLSAIPKLTNRRIIYGYASVAMIDRENQKISISALRDATKRFMAEPYYRPITIFHSDAVVGRIIPKFTDPKSGKEYKTEVDGTGWKIIAEIRNDIELAHKIWEEVLKGNIKSFSVAGTSKKKHIDSNHGISYTEIDELDLFETTLCSIPVNPMAIFEVLWDPNKVAI